jgi:hypothetical protein
MNVVLNAARAGIALMAMSVAFGVAVAATSDDPTPQTPTMTLLNTDTTDVYRFAAIEVGHQIYHVTEGDVLDGVYIRHIGAGRVTLSGEQTLVAGQPLRPEAIPGAPGGQVARADDR